MATNWLRSGLLTIALTACGTKPPPPANPPIETVATPTPDAPSPEPATAEPVPEPAPPKVVEPPPPPAPEIAQECRGAKLDIAKLAKLPACRIKKATKTPIPPSVTVALVPDPVALKSGGKVDAAIVLTNTSDAEVVLVFYDCLDTVAQVTYEMLDDTKNRVDTGHEGCGSGGSCSQSPLGIAIAPKGTARLAFALEAKMEIIDRTCSHKRGKPLRKGTFDLKVSSQLGPDLTSKITVR